MQIKDWYKGGSSKHEPVPCRWSGQVDTWNKLNEARKVMTLAWSIDLTESATMGILKGPARQSQSCQQNPPTRVEPICRRGTACTKIQVQIATYPLMV